jgi:hypothetical protein
VTEELKIRLVDAFNSGRTPADRLAACRLIDASPETMAFVFQLEADKSRITTLPFIKAPSTIFQKVSQAIQPPIVVNRLHSRQMTVWRSYALAASILIAVGIGSYFIATSLSRNNNSIVRKPSVPVVPKFKSDRAVESSSSTLAANREILPMPGRLAIPSDTIVPKQPSTIDRDEEKNWLGARVIAEMPPFDAITPRLPFLISMTEWSGDDVRTRLRLEFAASHAFRLDLFARDVPKTVEQLINLMKNQGVSLTTVAMTTEQLKRKIPANYVIYCEALTVDDWMTLFSKWKPEETTSFAHFLAAGAIESRELKSLLGIDPVLTKRPSEDSNRPVGEQTIEQVARALQKNKTAILTTAGPNGYRVNPGNSPETRLFAERRGERLMKAVPMMIVIRPAI